MKWLLVAISIHFGAAGQLLMKTGVKQLDGLNHLLQPLVLQAWSEIPWGSVLWIVGGILCYAIAMIVWIYVLQHFELSVAYPLLSLGYILVYFGAVYWTPIGEAFSWEKSLGILLIVFGVILVTVPVVGVKHASR